MKLRFSDIKRLIKKEVAKLQLQEGQSYSDASNFKVVDQHVAKKKPSPSGDINKKLEDQDLLIDYQTEAVRLVDFWGDVSPEESGWQKIVRAHVIGEKAYRNLDPKKLLEAVEKLLKDKEKNDATTKKYRSC